MSLLTEQLRTLTEASREIPGRPHITTMMRWSLRGIRGIKLETILIGGRRFTSEEAIERFIERLSDTRPGVASQPSTAQLQKDARANEELTRLGF